MGVRMRLRFNADEPLQLGQLTLLDYASFGVHQRIQFAGQARDVSSSNPAASACRSWAMPPLTKIGSGTAS